MQKTLRWIECFALFGLAPIPLYYMMITPASDYPFDLGGFEPRRILFPLLWLIAIAAIIAWKKKHKGQKIFTRIPWGEFKKKVLPRFALSCVFMAGLTYALVPERLFGFPLERPQLWLLVMTFYPLFSVIPQEIIYRLFFFDRYQSILGSGWLMILVSGLAFGHGHILFNNWIAYVLSIAGGILFSITYARTRNMSLVWLEHAIYGQFVFTIGLGWFFYTGGAGVNG